MENKNNIELPETFTDITGTVLTPGKPEICNGNGRSIDENGELIECCCDGCEWFLYCF